MWTSHFHFLLNVPFSVSHFTYFILSSILIFLKPVFFFTHTLHSLNINFLNFMSKRNVSISKIKKAPQWRNGGRSSILKYTIYIVINKRVSSTCVSGCSNARVQIHIDATFKFIQLNLKTKKTTKLKKNIL